MYFVLHVRKEILFKLKLKTRLFGRPLFEGTTGFEVLNQNRNLDELKSQLKITQSEIKDPKSQINKSGISFLEGV